MPCAELVWPPSGSERSGDGRARCSQTARAWPRAARHKILKNLPKNLKKRWVSRQSPFARKALCATGRAGPLACAAAAVYPAIHKPWPAAAHPKSTVLLDNYFTFFFLWMTLSPTKNKIIALKHAANLAVAPANAKPKALFSK